VANYTWLSITAGRKFPLELNGNNHRFLAQQMCSGMLTSASNQRLELVLLECRICCSLMFNKTKQNKSLSPRQWTGGKSCRRPEHRQLRQPGPDGRSAWEEARRNGGGDPGDWHHRIPSRRSVGRTVVLYTPVHYCPYHYCVYYYWSYRYYRY
jgi:hypothetical protein